MVANHHVINAWLRQVVSSTGRPLVETTLAGQRQRSRRKRWRSTWRISCALRYRGKPVQLRFAKRIILPSAKCLTSTSGGFLWKWGDSMQIDCGTESLELPPATSLDVAEPDFDDSSLDSWQSGRYIPPPPFVPIFGTYREQIMAHASAYSRVLLRGTPTPLAGDCQVYNRP